MATTARKMCFPSALERRWLCPGSARQEAAYPYEQTNSPAAAEGIMLHDMAMELLKDPGTDLHAIQAHYASKGPEFPQKLTEEHVQAVRWVEGIVRPIMERPGFSVVFEESLDMRHVGIDNRYKLDILVLDQDHERVPIELKFGRAFVTHPKWNKQTRAYTYGAMEHFGGEYFRSILLQPRALNEEHRHREVEWEREQVERFGDEIRGIVAGCEDEAAPLVPGDKQCLFCRANETCEARAATLRTVPLHLKWEDYMDSLEPVERYLMVKRLDAAAAYVKTLQKATERYVLEGNQVPGFTIGETQKKKTWRNPEEAAMRLRGLALDLGKNPEDLFTAPELKGTTGIYGVLGGGKAIKAEVQALQYQPQGEPCMVEDRNNAPRIEAAGRAFLANFIDPEKAPENKYSGAA